MKEENRGWTVVREYQVDLEWTESLGKLESLESRAIEGIMALRALREE